VQIPQLQVIRKSTFRATPWKNGGGVTHEAMRVPASGDPFRWRVSVAHIDASGPFSDFADYNRKMVLLQGAGIELRFGDGGQKTLRQVGDLVEFDGALPTYCELLTGPCVDLNLMVSKADGVAVRVERFIEPVAVHAARNETLLVFAIDRRVTLQIEAGETVTLEPWDLAVLSTGTGSLRRLESGDSFGSTAAFGATAAFGSTAVFLATLEFVSGE
jgi:environmental stress-induced protein Ves